MTQEELINIVRCGETTTVQFKEQFTGQKEIAKEMIAFANTRGGQIIFGINDKTGDLTGISYDDIQAISRELGNTANEQVRPTIYIETDVVCTDLKYFLVCTVAQGKNKPYKNLNGEIWVKQGADKRRITENSEILALFQDSGTYAPDADGVKGATMADLDRYALDGYLKKVYALSIDTIGGNAERLLTNIHVLNADGTPTLAGYLFFGKHPEYHYPTCMVKAVSFFGNDLAGSQYRDTKEIVGSMPQVYEQSMAFLKSNLRNIQEQGASFNTLGKLEIPEEVLEEVLQNSLVHRDLLRTAPIRLFIFDNRVEVVSPGDLAGGLTVNDIRNGKTYQRNPFMATFATNALHYRGIGSGIVRILAERPDVQITNDVDGKEFKVTIMREASAQTDAQSTAQTEPNSDQKGKQSAQTAPDSAQSTAQTELESAQTGAQSRILNLLKVYPKMTRREISKEIGISEDAVKRLLAKLKDGGYIERVGADFGGYWNVIKTE